MDSELREKLNKFRKNRKACWSLIILLLMFLLSLPAELIFNDKPIIIKVDGKYYFPFLKDYSMHDFGGNLQVPIVSYKSKEFMNFLNGIKEKEISISDMFGEDEEESEEIEKTPATKKNYSFLWALVRHSHKSTNENPESGRNALASPMDEYIKSENRTYKSSWIDQHYLGTDQSGKDVLARIVYGFRISMFFGLGIAFAGIFTGCIIGALQGYFGGWIDMVGQRFIELWGSLPQLFLLIILSSFLANYRALTDFQHYLLLFGIINLTAWMGMATFMRAEFLKARSLEYVKAARALGASNFKIMRKHILPNSLTPVITFFPFRITAGILAIVSLDFLGLGVKYPAPSLGDLLSQGQENLHALWIILPTFFILSLTLTLLTFIGDGVRNAFDPRSH